MRRSELAMLAIVPAILYASLEGLFDVSPLDLPTVFGVLAAVFPAIGLVRRDLAALGWLPGSFLGIVLFLLASVSPTTVPGALGSLCGGWAIGSPIFAGIAAASAPEAPGRRTAALLIALLAGAAVLALASPGGSPTSAVFATAFAQLPREQAIAIAGVLTGGGSAGAPFEVATTPLYTALVLLAGAGGLASVLGLEPEREPEALGFDHPAPNVPEGTFRSLLPDGRLRLAEGSPPEQPMGPDRPALLSVLVAVSAALLSLTAATLWPDQLLEATAGAVIALLAVALFALWSRRSTNPAPLKLPVPKP
jgi:hypothetical protein